MKRFGGIEFLSRSNLTVYDLLDETLIQQLANINGRINQTIVTINATKLATLFRIHPPQASVTNRSLNDNLHIYIPVFFLSGLVQ